MFPVHYNKLNHKVSQTHESILFSLHFLFAFVATSHSGGWFQRTEICAASPGSDT